MARHAESFLRTEHVLRQGLGYCLLSCEPQQLLSPRSRFLLRRANAWRSPPILSGIQVLQRWIHFAIANPARQLFFTVVTREEKYKAKNLVDVVVYRGSDALSGWIFDSMQALGLKLGAIALFSLPVVAGWLVLSMGLGRAQERRSAQTATPAAETKRQYGFDPV